MSKYLNKSILIHNINSVHANCSIRLRMLYVSTRCIKILSINVGHSYLFIQTTHDIQPCSLDNKDLFVVH